MSHKHSYNKSGKRYVPYKGKSKGKGKSRSINNDPYQVYDSPQTQSFGPIVYFNKDFQDNVPLYFLDSGIVILLGMVKLLEDRGATEDQILYAMQASNPRNVNYVTANTLFNLYQENKAGKVAFCLPPTVYKETMIDGSPSKRNRIDRVYTRKFVRENCFVVFPDKDTRVFAAECAKVQDTLKKVHTPDRFYGLNVEMVRGQDDNFEDRLIISQTACLSMHGKMNVNFVSCSSAPDSEISRWVSEVHEDSKIINPRKVDPELSKNVVPKFILLQINSKDFGRRNISNSHGEEAIAKDEVATQLETEIEKLFGPKGGVKVLTPEELDYEFRLKGDDE